MIGYPKSPDYLATWASKIRMVLRSRKCTCTSYVIWAVHYQWLFWVLLDWCYWWWPWWCHILKQLHTQDYWKQQINLLNLWRSFGCIVASQTSVAPARGANKAHLSLTTLQQKFIMAQSPTCAASGDVVGIAKWRLVGKVILRLQANMHHYLLAGIYLLQRS